MVSKIGDRGANEDAAVCIERDGGFCFVVADGLGGHGGGAVASRILIKTFERESSVGCDTNGEFLKRAFDAAQEEIVLSRQSADEMMTTGVALSIMHGKFAWCHIGDSRLYYFHRKRFRERTLDHSLPQLLAISGEITDDDIRYHPDRNRLLRALGDERGSRLCEFSKEGKLSKGDAFLLCTDGFWECLSDTMISRALKSSATADEWLSALLSIVEASARDRTMDNYTAITVIV
jgi:serine/threonine protein phosphatase PrpC